MRILIFIFNLCDKILNMYKTFIFNFFFFFYYFWKLRFNLKGDRFSFYFDYRSGLFHFTGESEARAAAKAIRDAGLKFDIAYTSVLSRAFRSAEIILDAINQTDIPLCKTWRLNERHYGSLTGLNRVETAAKYGEEQVSNC